MKLFFAAFVCLIGLNYGALNVPDHLKAPAKVLHDTCQAETNVAEEHIQNSRNGNLPDVPELRCYVRCLFDHAGMIDEDGAIHHKEIAHMFSAELKESFDHVTDKCKTIYGKDPCETAYLTMKCFFETLPEGSELP